MVPMNFAKLTLFFVVLTSLATSQPFSRSHGASRRSGFEWNTRKIGAKRVATISVRKDEERDRRSIPLGDSDSSFRNPPPLSHSPEAPSDGERRHHHHRHHHGEQTAVEDVEWVPGGGGGGGGRAEERRRNRERDGPSDVSLSDMFDGSISPHRLNLNDAQLSEIRASDGTVDTTRLQEILASVGLDVNAELFRNVTESTGSRQRKGNGSKKSGKKKKRSKKVKRDRRKRNRGKKGKNKGRRKLMKKCRHLKGREKKRCRAAARPPAESGISMSGSEACQYHNLEECCRKVGFLSLRPESLETVSKCRYREEFFDCMEEQRLTTCDPNFKTKGDMKALRKKIRDVIWTTTSCLISEVMQG